MNASSTRRWTTLALLTSAAIFCGATSAQAALQVEYSTTGTFSPSNTSSFSQGNPLLGQTTITFHGVNGTASLNPGGFDLDSFGTISADTQGLFGGGGSFERDFTLTVTMSAPPSPDSPGSFGTAELSGIVIFETGGATLHFTDPTSLTFEFSNVDIDGQLSSGSVTFSVPDFAIPLAYTGFGDLSIIPGKITADFHPVPEPSTVAMALSALVPLGVVGVRRFRRKQAAN